MRKELKYLIRGQHDGTGLRNLRADADRTASHVKKQFAGMGTALKAGLIGGVAGGLAAGLANLFQAAGDAIEKLDGIAKRARTSGLTAGFYQTISVAANEASIAQGVLDSSLTAFVKRMGELQGGTGPLVSTLAKVDGELLKMLQTATSQEEALRIVAQRMREYESPAQRAAVASALFSRAGVDMTRVLAQGAEVFDVTRDKAERLGLIIETELLDKAERIQNDYGLATEAIDIQFKSALVELAPVLTAAAGGVGEIAKEVRSVAAAASEVINDPDFQKLDAWFRENGPMGADGGIGGRFGKSTNQFIKNAYQDLIATRNQMLADIYGGRAQIADNIVNTTMKGDLGQIKIGQKPNTASKSDFGVGNNGGGGRTVPPIPRIKPPKPQELVDPILQARDPVNLLTDDFARLAETTTSWQDTLQSGLSGIGSSLVGVARGTESLNSVLDRTIDRITSMFADQAFNTLLSTLFGGGGGGGFLSGLFGGAGGGSFGFMGLYAAGGTLGAGQWGIAGEAGPELVEGPARITPMSGRGSSVTYSPATVINISGSMSGDERRRLEAMLDQRDQANRRRFGQMFVETQSRGGLG